MNPQEKEEANRLKACESLSAEGRKHFKFIEFDENEQLVTEIRKHPFGILSAILFTGAIVAILAVAFASYIAVADLNKTFESGRCERT